MDLERLTKSIFVVELKTLLFLSLRIVWENSGVKWTKALSINSIVTKCLMFKLSRYFLGRIKINYRRVLGNLSTNFVILLLIQIQFETNVFRSTKFIWKKERKERINKLFISLRKWPTFWLKHTAQLEKRIIFMKNGNEGGDVLGDLQKYYRWPWAEIGKYILC